MDNVFISMTVESADDGKDDWEAVSPRTEVCPMCWGYSMFLSGKNRPPERCVENCQFCDGEGRVTKEKMNERVDIKFSDGNKMVKAIQFDYAKNYRLRFGPKNYVGRTLDEIARQDDGLKYLDQLLGQDWVFQDTKDIIKAYLGSEAIKRDLESLLQ
jgi:hypothetical protein